MRAGIDEYDVSLVKYADHLFPCPIVGLDEVRELSHVGPSFDKEFPDPSGEGWLKEYAGELARIKTQAFRGYYRHSFSLPGRSAPTDNTEAVGQGRVFCLFAFVVVSCDCERLWVRNCWFVQVSGVSIPRQAQPVQPRLDGNKGPVLRIYRFISERRSRDWGREELHGPRP